ncbi:peptidoglycan DD-metalloendopeptidase family protein [Nocardioides pacificus]
MRGIGLGVGVLLLLPVIVVVLIMEPAVEAASCFPGGTAPVGNTVTGDGAQGDLRIAHANIKGSVSAAGFRSDLMTVVGSGPDAVSLNEVSRRSDREITPAGYKLWRVPNHGADGTAVLYRADRWTKVDSGRVIILAQGPQRWDRSRAATWVTLRDAEGGRFSMVSMHHMVNPARIGPNKPLRQQLYAAGMDKVAALAERLSPQGPVFIAGDMNSQYNADDPWGPRKKLAPYGYAPTFDELGRLDAHDGGAAIDMIFYPTDAATPLAQGAQPLNSDHHGLWATFRLGKTNAAKNRLPGPPAAPAAAAEQVNIAGLAGEQARNAATIVKVGNDLGVPPQAHVVALATALQESGLRNLDHGDRDSLGLFQQRPSTGWGSSAQIRNPVLATRAFYGRAAHTNNPGLLDIAGWEQMRVSEAAQAVQRSGFPDAYADDEDLARRLLAQLDATTAALMSEATDASACATPVGATTCAPTGLAVEEGLKPDALAVLRCVQASFGPHDYAGVGERSANSKSDHPKGLAVDVMIRNWSTASGIAEGDAIAAWLQQHAREFGITYLIWRARIWNAGDTGWRPYSHPSGATDPTSAHMDHVHVSVHGNAGTGYGSTTGNVTTPLPPGIYIDQDNWREVSPIRSSWHTGNDLSAPCGTPVRAAHAGTVIIDRHQAWAGPYLVKISQGPGRLTTWYAHMQNVTVSAGARIQTGEQIGAVGNLGNSRGCHLHFEVHTRGGSIYGPDNVNPVTWLAQQISGTAPRNVPASR